MNISKLGIAFVVVVSVIAILFIGVEIGKIYVARNQLTDAIASIDPFKYCDLHNKNVEAGLTKEILIEEGQMENYAIDLYISMTLDWQKSLETENATLNCKDAEDKDKCCQEWKLFAWDLAESKCV